MTLLGGGRRTRPSKNACPSFVDTMFVLDDVSAMDAAEADQYTRLRNFAYMVATNQGKARARAYKGSTGMSHADTEPLS